MLSLKYLAALKDNGLAADAVSVEWRRCLHSRLSSTTCRRCFDTCHRDAIYLQDRHVRVDNDHCSRCMRCRAVCPGEAIRSQFDLSEVFTCLSNRREATVSCDRNQTHKTDDLVVPCLGIFSKALILALGGTGSEKIIFRTEHCKSCVNEHVIEEFQEDVSRLAPFLETRCKTKLIIATEVSPPSGQVLVSRRLYLATLKDSLARLQRTPTSGSKPSESRASLSHRHIPEIIKRLNLVLDQVDLETAKEIKSSFLPQLHISSTCTLCPRCSGICPTGAIKRRGSGAERHIVFKASLCSGCRLCKEFCKESAISLTTFF